MGHNLVSPICAQHDTTRATDHQDAPSRVVASEHRSGGDRARCGREWGHHLRGVILEVLGDAEGALAAYPRYLDLAGADAARKAQVARRVQALTAGLKPAAP